MMDEDLYNKLDLFSGYVGVDLTEQLEMHITFSELMPCFFNNLFVLLSCFFLLYNSFWWIAAASIIGHIAGKLFAKHSGMALRITLQPILLIYNLLSKFFLPLVVPAVVIYFSCRDWKTVAVYSILFIFLQYFGSGTYQSGTNKNNKIANQVFDFFLRNNLNRG